MRVFNSLPHKRSLLIGIDLVATNSFVNTMQGGQVKVISDPIIFNWLLSRVTLP
ncbi:hypothetical protein [Candidatus Profftia tarda]|uniref:hypothetical protein n=1 Tax=Candidatus Profftia tarda TaxID=1177216 RepID=UPI001C1F2F54|nr:hypothetical protein [Candidatus Profftia tarda]